MSSCEIIEGITLHHGDCRDIMRALPADHFDAIITDPPYGIAFKGEKWDTATPRGFQAWCESWATEALRILKPGGYLLAFSAPRTYHRLTAGIEDAGFAIRDAMAWIRAAGHPHLAGLPVGLFRLAHTRSVCIYYTRASLLHRLELGALPFRSARPPFTLCGACLSLTSCIKYTQVRILVSSGGTNPTDRPKGPKP